MPSYKEGYEESLKVFTKYIRDVVDQAHGDLIDFILCGCGSHILDILKVPGASGVINGVTVPYSTERFNGLCLNKIEKFVSKEACDALVDGLNITTCFNNKVFCVTGSLTTNRYRKGLNQVIFGDYDFHQNNSKRCLYTKRLTLNKLSENEYNNLSSDDIFYRRNLEDLLISSTIMYNSFNVPYNIQIHSDDIDDICLRHNVYIEESDYI